MTVNAPEPQVRSGTLPTQTPRTIQRPAQPAEMSSAEADVQAAAQTAAKPKRQYKPRKPKAKLGGEVGDLSSAELAAWGRIALKAARKGISPEKYMAGVIAEFGDEIAVFQKLHALAQAAQPQEGTEQASDAPEAAAA